MDRDLLPDFIDDVYEATVKPERLDELITYWDARLTSDASDLPVRLETFMEEQFVQHVERALQILDELHAFEFRQLDEMLSAVPAAAIVFSPTGVVVAANAAARDSFGLYPGGTFRSMPIEPADLRLIETNLARVALGARDQDCLLRLRPLGRPRDLHVHMRPVQGSREHRHVLVVSSDLPWRDEVGAALARMFRLTEAEVTIVRELASGATVAEIAAETRRQEGTVRSQLHSILGKTATCGQAEMLRLVGLLQHSFALTPERVLRWPFESLPVIEGPNRSLHLKDGRRLTVLRFGDPAGRTVVWLQSSLGLFYPKRSAEADLMRAGLRVIVPIRAGFGSSDPVPAGRDVLEVAVDDLVEMMDQLGLAACPVVAPMDDIRIALTLARTRPDRVRSILSISPSFPILSPAQYRRLHPVGRVFLACARHAPHVLPFLVRLIRARMIRAGIDEYARANFRTSPGDRRAMAVPEIADAFVAGFTYIYGADTKPEQAFCAELRRYRQDWPVEIGHVACPVTLVHGEEDGNNPFETAKEYAELYPAWRVIGHPGEGQLVGHTRWKDILRLLTEALEEPLPHVAIEADAVTQVRSWSMAEKGRAHASAAATPR